MTAVLVGSDDPAWDVWPEDDLGPDDGGQARLDLAPDDDLARDDLARDEPDPDELAPLDEPVEPPLLDRAQQIAQLRRRLAAVPATGARAAEVGSRASAPAADPGDGRVLAVPGPLRDVLPQGGLVRGSVVALDGAGSLVSGLVAAVTAAGGWAGVVGRPETGVLAAAEMGADLRRLALVPRPGRDPVDVAAVLLDGMDLVVLDLAGLAVSPSRARAVVARARARGAVLAVTGGTWPGVELELHAVVTAHLGMGRGHGRLVGRELAVRVRGRGQAARPRTSTVVLRADGAAVRWLTPVPTPGRAPAPLRRTGTGP